jgi:hypothetical protein
MTQFNPPGTMFLGLIEELMDLLKKPEVSRIEVVMASYEHNQNGENKLLDGKHSVALRGFVIRGMNKEVQEKLREQFEAEPITHLVIFWIERFQNENKVGILRFDPVTKKKAIHNSPLDEVEKNALSDYVQRQTK